MEAPVYRSLLLVTAALLAACSGEDPPSPEPAVGLEPPCPTWYADGDGDGYGDHLGLPLQSCKPPPEYVDNNLDCDDHRADIHPDGIETCDDEGHDEDCDGLVDEDDPGYTGGAQSWPDADGDGYGDVSATPQTGCGAPDGWSMSPGDCDDADPVTYPGAAYNESTACMRDADGDGYGASNPPVGVVPGTDCEDRDVYHWADCDTCEDQDGDGYGVGCDIGADCNDQDPQINPFANDQPLDGMDTNCDGVD